MVSEICVSPHYRGSRFFRKPSTRSLFILPGILQVFLKGRSLFPSRPQFVGVDRIRLLRMALFWAKFGSRPMDFRKNILIRGNIPTRWVRNSTALRWIPTRERYCDRKLFEFLDLFLDIYGARHEFLQVLHSSFPFVASVS